ncbi:hypothetical protein BC830DRAFT_1102770 [Chytriomyces sp. MP71]|nr:hypothetical protein BC830DRAFT_1102770 [Chytriomyces sp. MP71]
MSDIFAAFGQLIAAHPPSTLNDFGFMPPSEDKEGPYAPFVLVEGNLGVPANWIEPLCHLSHSIYFRLKDLDIADTTKSVDRADLTLASMLLLLMNPEIYSAWNTRKRLLVARTLSLTEELAFVDLVLTKHPKRPSAWTHRAWLLARWERNFEDNARAHELDVCDKAARRYRMNYHAWTHRWKVTQDSSLEFKLFAFQRVKTYICSHISEHSAFAHALAVFDSILQNEQLIHAERLELFEKELRETMKLIVRYPGHKSPWCYLRGLYLTWSRHGDMDITTAFVSGVSLSDLSTNWPHTPRGSLLSEVDVMDWLIEWLDSEDASKQYRLASRLLRFAAWVIYAAELVAQRHGQDKAPVMWTNQIEAALELQLYLLHGLKRRAQSNGQVSSVENGLIEHVRVSIERVGPCSPFLLMAW